MRLWIVSLLFYCFIFVLCEILRIIARKCFETRDKKGNYHLALTIANEFIGTVQICAPMFDVNFVLENYGLHGVLFEIAFIEVANAFLLRDAVADPCPLFHGVLKGKRSLGKFATLLGFQFVAAYFSFLVARTFWRMGLHPQHIDMWQSEQCSADLTVTILYGSIVEAIGLISSKVAEKFFERRLLSSNQTTLACALTSGLITVLGIHLTGMYANPIVAWACTFNCGEVSHVSHFVVYWLAPFSAYTLTDLLLKDEDDEGERETVKESDKKLD